MSLGNTMRWVGAIGIASIAILRCLVLFAPQVVFDTDPAVKDAMPLAGLGPAGSMMLDALLLLACALGLLGEWLKNERGLEPLLIALALIPFPIVLYHGAHDAGNLWRGMTLATAALACVTMAHLARDPRMRIVFIALLVAAIVPLLARAAAQMTYEHAATVKEFEQTKDEFFRTKGLTPGSSAALMFERRLRQPQPLGWFATTNIFASLAGFSFIVFVGLAVSAFRAKLESGWGGAMALLGIVAGAALVSTGSKGAAGAVVLGMGLFLFLNLRRSSRVSPGAVVLGLIAMTIIGVVARGVLLPESFANDKSLLFRWHYMIASVPMFFDHFLTGVGADGFQEAYTRYRVPRNPEEVMSAHSMFIDWLCMLGVVGAAWVFMVAALVIRARISDGSNNGVESRVMDRSEGLRYCVPALAAFFLAIVPAIVLESSGIDSMGLMTRALGGIGMVVVATLIAFIVQHGDRRTIAITIIAAIAMLLIHGQIEMTFHQPGAVVWAMCAVGLIGGAPPSETSRLKNAVTALGSIGVALGVAVWLTVTAVIPAFQQQRAMVRAAEMLRLIPERPDDVGLMIQTRRSVAEALVRAYELWPRDVRPLDAAVNQLQLASSRNASSSAPQPLGLLMEARDLVNRAVREHGKSSSLVDVARINTMLGQITGDREYWNAAINAAQLLSDRDPNSLNAWRRLGDVRWLSGDHAGAAAAYERALQCNANFALDALKQLSEKDRALLKDRINEARSDSR